MPAVGTCPQFTEATIDRSPPQVNPAKLLIFLHWNSLGWLTNSGSSTASFGVDLHVRCVAADCLTHRSNLAAGPDRLSKDWGVAMPLVYRRSSRATPASRQAYHGTVRRSRGYSKPKYVTTKSRRPW